MPRVDCKIPSEDIAEVTRPVHEGVGASPRTDWPNMTEIHRSDVQELAGCDWNSWIGRRGMQAAPA